MSTIISDPIPESYIENPWRSILELIQRTENPKVFTTWYRPTRQVKLKGRTLTVEVPTPHHANYLHRNFDKWRFGPLREVWDGRIDFVIREPEPSTPTAPVVQIVPSKSYSNWKAMEMTRTIINPCKDITPVAKLVAMELAARANKDGVCWPSIQRLANDAGVSRPAAQRAVKQLEMNSHLHIRARAVEGVQTSHMYRILWL